MEWMSATLARVIEGLATGGIALPALMAESFAEYMLFVRGVTPPAKGARTVGSVELGRGKAAIDIDMGRAFVVSAKGAVMTLAGGALVTRGAAAIGRAAMRAGAGVTAAATRRLGTVAGRLVQSGLRRGGERAARAASKRISREILTAADEDPNSWYQSQRSRGRFRGTVKMQIDASQFRSLRAAYQARVGKLQAGWNAATTRFNMRAPSWISSKSGAGRVLVKSGGGQYNITATNDTGFSIADMQRRIDYATRRATESLERKAKGISENLLSKFFNATPA